MRCVNDELRYAKYVGRCVRDVTGVNDRVATCRVSEGAKESCALCVRLVCGNADLKPDGYWRFILNRSP